MIIHATDPGTYKKCRRLFYYKNVLRLDAKEEQVYFQFGKAGHSALHAHYLKSGDPFKVFEDEAQKYQLDWTLIEDGLAMLANYFDYYADEQVGEIVSCEEVRSISYGDVTFNFTIDMLEKTGNGYTIWDHKFYSSFPSNTDLQMMEQATTYIWGLKKMGFWPVRFKLNVIRKEIPMEPGVLKSGALSIAKTQLTTTKLFRAALDKYGLDAVDYGEYLEWLEFRADPREGIDPFLRRYSTTRSAKELERFEQDLWDELVDMTADRGYYRNPGLQCNQCLFYDLCRTDYEGGDMQLMIDTNYKKKEDGVR